MTDFLKYVPREIGPNLEYRIGLRKRAAKDVGFRNALMVACRHDILFWLNAFCFLHEPRSILDARGKELPHVVPFITRPRQDEVIPLLRKLLGYKDIGAEKARGWGMSWVVGLLALHDWIFRRDVTIGLGSSSEEKADKPGDRGSMLGKLDWELEMLPEWMTGKPKVDWRRHRADHLLEHFKNRTVIVSSASTGKTGRGHRYLWYGLDELSEWDETAADEVMASLQHTTNSRLFIGTPLGTTGAYYEIMHRNSSMEKIVLDWKDDPSRNRGLYKLDGPMPVALDPENNPLPKHYNPPTPEVLELIARLRSNGFRLDGTIRSPWYDTECDRPHATPQRIAQELDRDYGGSQFKLFGHEITGIMEGTTRQPLKKGMLDFHVDTLEPSWDESDRGPVLLWCTLFDGRPAPGKYVAGVDVCAGLGGAYTSNSVLEIFNSQTGEQVLEFATNTLEPNRFADLCIAACKWFHDAYLSWEINGPGAAMTRRIVERKYMNVYMREAWEYRSRKKKKALGWHTRKETKEIMFDEIKRTIRNGRIAVRSVWLAEECGQYVMKAGVAVHAKSKTADDGSAGEAHGDRVIALGVALQAMRDKPQAEVAKTEDERLLPMYTEAGRMREYELELERADDFDSRTNWDLVA